MIAYAPTTIKEKPISPPPSIATHPFHPHAMSIMMHRFFVLLFTLSIGCAPKVAPNTVQTPLEGQHKRYPAAVFYQNISVFGASFSADHSKILYTSDKSGVYNTWSVSTDSGVSKQLTDSKQNTAMAIAYFKSDDRFLFTGDEGGNEQNHILVQELDGSKKDLTPGKLKASFGGFGHDGTHFYIWTNERDPKYFDAYRYDATTYKREMLFENKAGWSRGVIDPHGRYIAVTKTHDNANNDMHLIDLNSDQKTTHISKHEGDIRYSVVGFTPDKQSLMYLSNGNGEFREAWQYNLKDGSHSLYAKRDWDIFNVRFSKNGKYYVLLINEDAKTQIEVLSSTGEAIAMPTFPGGDVKGITFADDEEQFVTYISTDREPSNMYLMKMGSNAAKKLSDTNSPEIDTDNLVDSEVIRYKSFDGLDIPAILYKPKTASASQQVPAVVYVHGGPGGQSRRGYSATIQHLVNHGYALLLVNNRGSSGYGKTFYHLDDKKHGDVDLKDCVWAKKYLSALPWVDGDKVAIMGGSYGGYMVAAALAFEPEVFDAGINIFGVTNWIRTLESIPPYWEAYRKSLYTEIGDPATDKERLRAISPLFHADKITRPMMVVQGANDVRVLQVESDELVEKARQNGADVEYLLFPDEGHGFRKKSNRIKASESYLKFLDSTLKSKPKKQKE